MDALSQFLSERYLLEIVLKGTLLMAAAFAVAFILQRASAALRHAVWSLAFISLLLLPVCAAFLPAWPIPLPELATTDALSAERPERVQSDRMVPSDRPVRSDRLDGSDRMNTDIDAPSLDEAASSSAMGAAAGSSARSATVPTWWWTAAALLVWMVGALLLFLRLGLVLYRLSIVRRSATLVTDTVWRERAEALTYLMEIQRPVRLLQHPDVVVPMTYGVRRPVILLPEQAGGWSDDQKHATLMHELLHVRRFDHLIHMLALAARALHWFNPLAWAAAKRLVVERERACDDGVLAMGVASTSYADHLLGMARYVLTGREASAAALAMARPSELRSRIVAILDPAQPRRSLSRTKAVVMSACALMLVVLVGAARPGAERADEADGYPLRSVQQTYDGSALRSESGAVHAAKEHAASSETSERTSFVADVASDDDEPEGSDADTEFEAGGLEDAGVSIADTTDLEAQKRAIHAIAELPSERGVPLLREIAETHDNEELRAEAIFWLGQSGDASTADLLVAFARNDPSREIQKRALFALAELEEGHGITQLMELARSHENLEVREEAVFWLGEAGGPEVAEQLESFARNDESEAVQKKAVFALSQMDDDAGLSRLIGLARSHPNPEIQAEAVTWLGEYGGSDVVDILLDLATNGATREIQKKALFALAQLDDNEGVDHLVDLARSHPDPAVRSEAVFWLGESEDPRAADVLMDIVNGR